MHKNITFKKLYFAIYSLTAVVFILFGSKEEIEIVSLVTNFASYQMLFFDLVSSITGVYVLIGISYLFLSKEVETLNHILTCIHYLSTTFLLIYIYKYVVVIVNLEGMFLLTIPIFEIRILSIILIIIQILCVCNILSTLIKNKSHQPIHILDDDL